MKKENVNKNIKTILFDLFICLISGIIVGFAYYLFSTPNDFAPGGVSGIASILSYLSGWNMGYFMIICNTPIFILVCIFVSKKTGIDGNAPPKQGQFPCIKSPIHLNIFEKYWS